nr:MULTISPECIES: site-2 protease family protein [Bacillaceae]
MFISFWSYTLLYPWKFSSTLILLIFIHEIGHVLAAKYRGLQVTAPTFIPFLGAFVITKNTNTSLEKRAFISIGGPIIGGISGIIFFLFGQQVAADWLCSAALLFLLVNLVNSFPFYPMDGFWILKAITYRSPKIQGILFRLFILCGFGVGIYFKNMTICIIYLLLLIETWLNRNDETVGKFFTRKLIVNKSLFLNNDVPIPKKRKKLELQFTPEKNGGYKMTMVQVFFPQVGMIGRIEAGKLDIKRLSLIETVQSSEQLVLTLSGEEGIADIPKDGIPQKIRWGYGILYTILVFSQFLFLYYFWNSYY